MTSIKAVHRKSSVYISLIHNRKENTKKLFSLDSKFWNNSNVKPEHPNSITLNKLLSDRLYQYQSKILKYQVEQKEFTHYDIFDSKPAKKTMVSDAIKKRMTYLQDKHQAFRKLQNLLFHFLDYGDSELKMFDINDLRGFENHLNNHRRINSLETSARYLKDLKSCLRMSNYNDYFVLNYKLTFGSKPKPILNWNEIDKLYDLDSYLVQLEKDIFLTCFFLWGTRISDVLQLQPGNINKGRMEYVEQKTGKFKSVPICDKLKCIIDRYKGQSTFYLFPMLVDPPSDAKTDMEYSKHIESKTAIVNKRLKLAAAYCGINEKLTTHIARHTFAVLYMKAKRDIYSLKEMLNHSSISVTEQYLKQWSGLLYSESDSIERYALNFGE